MVFHLSVRKHDEAQLPRSLEAAQITRLQRSRIMV
jgi:hypothetical protein